MILIKREMHGTWIIFDKDRDLVVCSKCVELFHAYNKKYLAIAGETAPSICPRCGAIMDGKQDVCKFV